MIRRASLIAALALTVLAGCLPGAPGAGGADATARPDLGTEAIEVTPLDAPDGAGTADAEPPAATDAATDATDATPAPAAASAAEPPEPAAAEETPVVKSAAQRACERRGGTWSRIGDSESRACVRRTRDGGKQCRRDSDCQGACLARSQTCAPIDPLFGCNDVLQDNGMRVTLCVE